MAGKKVAPATPAVAKTLPAKKAADKAGALVKAMGGKVTVGKKVPAFSSLITSGGATWKSSDAAGKHLVVYFYPRDNTSGCTLQGQQFRDLAPEFKKANTTILGVSTDSIASHE